MQLCNRIYYSKVYWRLNVFQAAHRSSSGALNCICSLWFLYLVTTWVYKSEAANTVLELLMMSDVPLETCWAFNKLCNNKFYYKAASCWYFYWDNLICMLITFDTFIFQNFHLVFLFLMIYKEATFPIRCHKTYVTVMAFLSRSITFYCNCSKKEINRYNFVICLRPTGTVKSFWLLIFRYHVYFIVKY